MSRLLVIILSLALLSCDKESHDGNVLSNPTLANQLRQSADTVYVNDNALVLTSYTYRDFMPIAEENGSDMRSSVKLTDVDSAAITGVIELKRNFVLNSNDIWIASYKNPNRNADYQVSATVTKGPKWGPDVSVDLVCEFEIYGVTYRLIDRNTNVEATY
ncbi:MAG: hypothetical protein ABR574_06155 [Cryomorphaceae bacterium]